MTEDSIRELRNHGGDVVDRVAAGERVTVTRAGKPVAELRPVRRAMLSSAVLRSRWGHLPIVDADAFRADGDAVLDATL